MTKRIDEHVAAAHEMMLVAEARLTSLVGVFKLLAEHHAEILVLLTDLEADPQQRPVTWPRVRAELITHEDSEVEAVYSVLAAWPETQALADDHKREAGKLSKLIAAVDAVAFVSSEWTTLYAELIRFFDAHVAEENHVVFEIGQRVLGEPRARELEDALRAAKKRVAESLTTQRR